MYNFFGRGQYRYVEIVEKKKNQWKSHSIKLISPHEITSFVSFDYRVRFSRGTCLYGKSIAFDVWKDGGTLNFRIIFFGPNMIYRWCIVRDNERVIRFFMNFLFFIISQHVWGPKVDYEDDRVADNSSGVSAACIDAETFGRGIIIWIPMKDHIVFNFYTVLHSSNYLTYVLSAQNSSPWRERKKARLQCSI